MENENRDFGPEMQEQNVQAPQNKPEPGKVSKLLLIILAVVIIGGGGYYIYSKTQKNDIKETTVSPLNTSGNTAVEKGESSEAAATTNGQLDSDLSKVDSDINSIDAETKSADDGLSDQPTDLN